MAKCQNLVAALVPKSNVLKSDPNAAETLRTKGFGTKKTRNITYKRFSGQRLPKTMHTKGFEIQTRSETLRTTGFWIRKRAPRCMGMLWKIGKRTPRCMGTLAQFEKPRWVP